MAGNNNNMHNPILYVSAICTTYSDNRKEKGRRERRNQGMRMVVNACKEW